MLMGGPHLRGALQGPCALLLRLYTRAGENSSLTRTLFRADATLPATVPKANNRGPCCVKNESLKNESRARRATSGRAGSPNDGQRSGAFRDGAREMR